VECSHPVAAPGSQLKAEARVPPAATYSSSSVVTPTLYLRAENFRYNPPATNASRMNAVIGMLAMVRAASFDRLISADPTNSYLPSERSFTYCPSHFDVM
jgi:hypothetical protein